jgi:ribose transport system permease protein
VGCLHALVRHRRAGHVPTWTTFKLVFVENVIVAVLSLAFLIPLTTATYDLSIGALMSMSLVITAYLSKEDVMSPVLAMLVALGACAIAGFISGSSSS